MFDLVIRRLEGGYKNVNLVRVLIVVGMLLFKLVLLRCLWIVWKIIENYKMLIGNLKCWVNNKNYKIGVKWDV